MTSLPIIYWQEEPELGSGWLSAVVGGDVELFHSMGHLQQFLTFEFDDYELVEVTPDNRQELLDSGVLYHV